MSWFEDRVPRYEPEYVTELEDIRLQSGVLEDFELEADLTEGVGEVAGMFAQLPVKAWDSSKIPPQPEDGTYPEVMFGTFADISTSTHIGRAVLDVTLDKSSNQITDMELGELNEAGAVDYSKPGSGWPEPKATEIRELCRQLHIPPPYKGTDIRMVLGALDGSA